MLAKHVQVTEKQIGFVLVDWIPFSSQMEYEINDVMVVCDAKMDEDSLKFYGSTLMKEDIASIHEQGREKLSRGEQYSDVLKEIKTSMVELGEDYSNKYGTDPNEPNINEEDLSEDRVLH